jgi:multidrug transporter EmrE-like cation transporter
MLILLLLGCVVFDVARELCFKLGAGMEGPGHVAWLTAGIAVWAVEIVAYAVVLTRLPLNVAFPVMSLTYVGSALIGWMVLGERVSARRWLGTGLIVAGVALIGSTG